MLDVEPDGTRRIYQGLGKVRVSNRCSGSGCCTARPLRNAGPVAVWCIWRRQDPHPATHAAVALASDLYRQQQ